MTESLSAQILTGKRPDGEVDARAEPRVATSSHTAALSHDGRRRLVRLVNLSRTGAMIRNCDNIAIGDRVTLQMIDHGEVEAEVRWAEDGRAGLHFARPLE